jgi:hypothetical protein
MATKNSTIVAIINLTAFSPRAGHLLRIGGRWKGRLRPCHPAPKNAGQSNEEGSDGGIAIGAGTDVAIESAG